MAATTDSPVLAPFAGTVIAVGCRPDDPVNAGTALVVLEAMKMEHEVLAGVNGVVRRIEVAVGDTVQEGQLLAVLGASESGAAAAEREPPPAAEDGREDLEAVREVTRSASTRAAPTRSPSATSEAVARRARTWPTSSTKARSSNTDR